MIANKREWLLYCIKLDGHLWRTMMRQAAAYRKHLVMDRDWEPVVAPDHKTASHARSWALLSLTNVDQYNEVLTKVREAREIYHTKKILEAKAKRRAYKREYMKAYRAKQAGDKNGQ